MPRYTYKCTACGQTADDDLPVADRDMPHVCGECEGDMVRTFAARARQCCAPGLTGEGCRCVLMPQGTVPSMTEPRIDDPGPVKSQSRDGITVTHYRPVAEVVTIIVVVGALIAVVGSIGLIIAAAVLG